ncbi:MAG: homoserine kinase [Spirochaetaceae bacterium]|nr:homoserine kinase [Spirochaetaceae bacterium]
MTEATVTVPATSANLGPGFDSLGLALSLRDEVRVRIESDSAPEVTLHVDGEGSSTVPRDASHLVVRSLLATYDDVGLARPRLTMWCRNRIPHGRGLGSSAAAAVAGVVVARELIGSGPDGQWLDDDTVLAIATGIEGHPDNAAACLFGGMTVAWTESTDGPESSRVHAVRIDPAPEVRALVLVPDVELSTERARGMLPAVVPHTDAAHSAGRAALLVVAMTGRPDLLLAATEDRLHQAYRAGAMPESTRLVSRLREAGMAAVVSGAGPSVLVLTTRKGTGIGSVEVPAGWTVLDLDVAQEGALVSRPGP